MFTLWMALTGSALTGCGGTDDTAAPTDPPVQSPTAGVWTVQSEDVLADTCGLSGSSSGTNSFNLSDTVDFRFTMVPVGKEGLAERICTLSDTDFSCVAHTDVTDFAETKRDAILTVSEEMGGDFPTWETMNANTEVNMTCEGVDCGEIGAEFKVTFPCALSATAFAALDP